MAADVTELDFEARVIERSRELPVVVDFWAEWCGPCRQLSPLIEKVAGEYEGRVELLKMDVDSNQRISQAFGIRGIPAVKAFRDGRVIDEFTGAQPPPVVERFFAKLVPSEAEELAKGGDEASLRKALELEPGRADAALPLARLLLERGERDEAIEILDTVRDSFAAEGLAARLRLEGDPELDAAFAALDAGNVENGLDAIIAAIPARDGARDDLRRVVVGVLDELGVEHPLAREYRRRLASALY